MKFKSVAEIAQEWNVSERTVRNYCAHNQIPGAFITGKTWNIPEDAVRPGRKARTVKPKNLLDVLKTEKAKGTKGGIYHKVQIDLTFNSNHMEGSQLTHEQTRFIYETNTIGLEDTSIPVDDIVETQHHFRCIDLVIEKATAPLNESFIKSLHRTLKDGTSDSRKGWFVVGDYKRLPNMVGGKETVPPDQVEDSIKQLLKDYHKKPTHTLEDLIEFHYRFECIHPFQDGNGRVGRLILFKECLKNGIVPFIIEDNMKPFYYRGLKEWKYQRGYLIDTCLSMQYRFKAWLDYFKIPYDE